jgi:hypothetical protein
MTPGLVDIFDCRGGLSFVPGFVTTGRLSGDVRKRSFSNLLVGLALSLKR